MATSPKPKFRGEVFNSVFNGTFPKEFLRKMSRRRLERFVLKLVLCSSAVPEEDAQDFAGLCRSLFLNKANRPQWWPSEQVISKTLTSEGKYLMVLLRFIVYKCCEHFKKPSEDLNSELFVTERDENEPASAESRGLKRKHRDVDQYKDIIPIKRRTLLPRNCCKKREPSCELLKAPVEAKPLVKVKDALCEAQSVDQDEFLKLFELKTTTNPTRSDTPLPASITSGSIKFNTCSQVPFSSDLGIELMKRDNHTCPEVTKSRRLERLEWYINKPPPKLTEIEYEISYQEKRDSQYRGYHFPKRQIWQHPGDMAFQMKAVFCRSLRVILLRQDLKVLQQDYREKYGLRVVVSKMTSKKGMAEQMALDCKSNNGGTC